MNRRTVKRAIKAIQENDAATAAKLSAPGAALKPSGVDPVTRMSWDAWGDGLTVNQETLDLGASEIACAVADAWANGRARHHLWAVDLPLDAPTLAAALDRLEAITRPSAMRKVRP